LYSRTVVPFIHLQHIHHLVCQTTENNIAGGEGNSCM